MSFWSKSKTYRGIEATPILVPYSKSKSGRVINNDSMLKKVVIKQSQGNAERALQLKWRLQKNYRHLFNQTWLKTHGYDISSSTVSSPNKANILSYIQQSISSSATAISNLHQGYPTDQMRYYYALQHFPGYDCKTNKVIQGNKEYSIFNQTFNASTDTVTTTVTMSPIDDITSTLKTSYSYNVKTNILVYQNANWAWDKQKYTAYTTYYTIPIYKISSPTTTATLNISKNSSINHNYSNSLFSKEVLFVAYNTYAGCIKYFMVAKASLGTSSALLSSKPLSLAPIVVLKANRQAVTPGPYRDKLFKRLNMGTDSFKDAIKDTDVHTLSITIAPNIKEKNNPYIAKALFLTYSKIIPLNAPQTNYNISTTTKGKSFSHSLSVSFNGERRRSSGSLAGNAKYRLDYARKHPTTVTGQTIYTSSYVSFTIQYQVAPNSIDTIYLENYIATCTIPFDWSKSYIPSPISTDILRRLPYKEFVQVFDNSFCFIAYNEKTIKLKWYQRGIFGVLLRIVGIILSVLSGQPLILVLVEMVIVEIIMQIALAIGRMIGGTIGSVIAAIIAVIATILTFDLDTSKFSTWLMAANETLTVIQQDIKMKADEYIARGEEYLKEKRKEIEGLDEKLAEAGFLGEDFNPIAGLSLFDFDDTYAAIGNHSIFETTEAYCSRILSTSVGYLVSYDKQIENSIKLRTNVNL